MQIHNFDIFLKIEFLVIIWDFLTVCLSKQVIFESLGKQIILNLNRCIFSRILRILPGIYANSLSLETQTSMMFCNSQMQMPKKVEEELKGYGTPFTNALVTSHWEIKPQFPLKLMQG